eukprot:TRINITY_DN2945_c0_g1_i1.p1 TRINITY_DN2945_c0_g1~~TRINITY_DN2945_c0_g1_i1.p1  ORF type:complete len:255 (+),score=77.27 TRINITY_DN2945_c0_g1_i1:41-805(+)
MKQLTIITGAAKGFGRAAAIEIAKVYPSNDVLLLGRDMKGLAETKSLLESIVNKDSVITIDELDLADLNNLDAQIDSKFSKINKNDYSKVIAISNSGSAVPLKTISAIESVQEIRSVIDMNITSCVVFNSKVLRKFDDNIILVNVSSLCALKAFHSVGIYSLGKAARNMLMSIIDVEAKEDKKNIKTLNYAPGPMDTDMQRQMREESSHQDTREFWTDMHKQGKLVNPNDSAAKMAKIISGDFVSGSHVDYYDA